jgi:hypothetical protein
MSAQAVIDVARGELGVCEEPSGSNRVKYWDAYDKAFQGQPWCVAFLWWAFNEAGERTAFFGGGKTASCSILLRWYREQGLTVPVEDVQVGDIVLLNFHGGKDPEHCGLVTEVNRRAVTRELMQIQTIEGNTSSSGSQSNRDSVCEKTRYPSQIVAVCRPQYQPEPEIVDDITGHWAEDAIRRCMERGLMVGYPDGSFQPDKPVTRAELATVLRRLMLVEEKEDDLK